MLISIQGLLGLKLTLYIFLPFDTLPPGDIFLGCNVSFPNGIFLVSDDILADQVESGLMTSFLII